MAKLQFPDALICIDSKCCHSFPCHNAVSPVLTVLEISVLTVAWNVFSHISWHYAINGLKMQDGIFFPCSAIQVREAVVVFALHFILSDAEVQSWRSVLLKWREPLWLNPPLWCFCSSTKSAHGSGAAPAASLAGHGSTRNSPCKLFCSGPCCRNPSGCMMSAWRQQDCAHG